MNFSLVDGAIGQPCACGKRKIGPQDPAIAICGPIGVRVDKGDALTLPVVSVVLRAPTRCLKCEHRQDLEKIVCLTTDMMKLVGNDKPGSLERIVRKDNQDDADDREFPGDDQQPSVTALGDRSALGPPRFVQRALPVQIVQKGPLEGKAEGPDV